MAMEVTWSFKGLVQKRAAADLAFAEASLSEDISVVLASDVDVGTSLLRDCIAVTTALRALESVGNTEIVADET